VPAITGYRSVGKAPRLRWKKRREGGGRVEGIVGEGGEVHRRRKHGGEVLGIIIFSSTTAGA